MKTAGQVLWILGGGAVAWVVLNLLMWLIMSHTYPAAGLELTSEKFQEVMSGFESGVAKVIVAFMALYTFVKFAQMANVVIAFCKANTPESEEIQETAE